MIVSHQSLLYLKPAALTVNLSDHDMPTFNSCSVVDVLSVHIVFDIMAVQPHVVDQVIG